jgi:hypothetical protein
MKQDAKGQRPGVDLSFSDGAPGRIWGVSGVDDLDGQTFRMAAEFLTEQARLLGTFEWSIIVELQQVVSTSAAECQRFFLTLAHLVEDPADEPEAQGSRRVTVDWRVAPKNRTMASMRRTVQALVPSGKHPNFVWGKISRRLC